MGTATDGSRKWLAKWMLGWTPGTFGPSTWPAFFQPREWEGEPDALVLAFQAAVTALIVGAVLWMTAVPGRSYEGPMPPLTAEQGELATP